MEDNKQLELVPEANKQEQAKQPEQALAVLNQPINTATFSDDKSFNHMQRVAKMLSSSSLVPESYRGDKNMANVMVALEMANRVGASPLQVMQNLNVIKGKPSWSSQFIIASINSCGKFKPLKFDVEGKGMDMKCTAWALEKETGDRLDGVEITMQMAKDEGWLNKDGSKWKTMPELMIRYRAAAFFGRLYAPEIMMGMYTSEEITDIEANDGRAKDVANKAQQAMNDKIQKP